MSAAGAGANRRLGLVLTLAGVTVAFTAAAAEIFHGTDADVAEAVAWRPPPPPASPLIDAPPAPTYKTISERRLGPNAGWSPHLAQLKSDKPGEPIKEPAARKAALAKSLKVRAQRRAYDGAPPVIPHAVDQQDVSNCLACHARGLTVAARAASVIPHDHLLNCTQCHAPSTNRKVPPSSLLVANTWRGLQPAGEGGARAWPGAPPVIPHPVAMRGHCAACHGTWGRPGLRTPHAERLNCTQCHAPSAALDQRDVARAGGPWPPSLRAAAVRGITAPRSARP